MDWHWIDDGLAMEWRPSIARWPGIDNGLAAYWWPIGIGLATYSVLVWAWIGTVLVLVLRRIDLDAPWIGEEMSPIQNGLSIGIGFVPDWHCIGIALAVIANLRQSSPICQSGGNPLIPRHYKQSRLTWIGVIEKSWVLYPYDIRFLDWQRIGEEHWHWLAVHWHWIGGRLTLGKDLNLWWIGHKLVPDCLGLAKNVLDWGLIVGLFTFLKAQAKKFVKLNFRPGGGPLG